MINKRDYKGKNKFFWFFVRQPENRKVFAVCADHYRLLQVLQFCILFFCIKYQIYFHNHASNLYSTVICFIQVIIFYAFVMKMKNRLQFHCWEFSLNNWKIMKPLNSYNILIGTASKTNLWNS